MITIRRVHSTIRGMFALSKQERQEKGYAGKDR